MRYPPPDELLRRLRAIYCNQKGLTYSAFDQLVEAEQITFAELLECVQVLMTQIQFAGLHDFIFQEDALDRQAVKSRRLEIEAELKRLGTLMAMHPTLREQYKPRSDQLVQEGRSLASA